MAEEEKTPLETFLYFNHEMINDEYNLWKSLPTLKDDELYTDTNELTDIKK